MPSTLAHGNDLMAALDRPPRAARIAFVFNEHTLLAPEVIRVINRRSPLPFTINIKSAGGERAGFADYQKYEALLDDLLAYKPDFIFTGSRHAGNDSTPLHLFAELWRIPFVHWYVDDPMLLDVHGYETEMDMEINLVNCADWIEPARRFGLKTLHFLPMGASPDRFKPATPDERPIPISLVGTLGTEKRGTFAAGVQKEFCGMWPLFESEANDYLDRAITWARANPGASIYEYLLNQAKERPSFTSLLFTRPQCRNAVGYLIDILGSVDDRLNIVKSLLPHGIKVFGPQSWLEHVPPAQFGMCDYMHIHEVYQQSKLVLNVSRNQSINVADQRHFDAALCGAVVVTEDMPGQRAFFDDDEALYYKNENEVAEKVAALLADEPRRLAMAEKARAKVLAMHTYDHRVDEIEKIVAEATPRQYLGYKEKPRFHELFNTWMDRFLSAGETKLVKRCSERFAPDTGDWTALYRARIYDGETFPHQLDPETERERFNLVVLALRDGKLADATVQLADLVKAYPDNAKYARLAKILEGA